jgi:branched-chain amino acid transport system substrate-binding protein
MSLRNYSARILLALAIFVIQGDRASVQAKYDVGAADTEIKTGNLMPYSGPASVFASVGKTIDAYFKKVDAEGGINGRKVTFVSYDDAYSSPKAVE